MRLVIPVREGRISPVFDEACRLLLVEVIGGEASFTHELPVRRLDVVAMVAELGADVVVCGAISRDLEERLLANGIEVVAEVRGAVPEVTRAYLDGSLGQPRFSMPGTHGRRRRPRRPRARGDVVDPASAVELEVERLDQGISPRS
jgi:predicted Fe-Mo cluster-binding NifX family protein